MQHEQRTGIAVRIMLYSLCFCGSLCASRFVLLSLTYEHFTRTQDQNADESPSEREIAEQRRYQRKIYRRSSKSSRTNSTTEFCQTSIKLRPQHRLRASDHKHRSLISARPLKSVILRLTHTDESGGRKDLRNHGRADVGVRLHALGDPRICPRARGNKMKGGCKAACVQMEGGRS